MSWGLLSRPLFQAAKIHTANPALKCGMKCRANSITVWLSIWQLRFIVATLQGGQRIGILKEQRRIFRVETENLRRTWEFHLELLTNFFLEQKAVPFEWDSINPVVFASEFTPDQKIDEKGIVSKTQELVIMVGQPASGKSTFTKKYFEPADYVRVNRDTLGTAAKCKKAVKEAFTEGLSVVVDNTNGSAATRQEYVAMASELDIPVRCFVMKTSAELSDHLNYLRVRETNGAVRRIPDVAFRTFNKHFEEPETSEGFTEIRTIDFIPDFKGNAEFEKMFKQWT